MHPAGYPTVAAVESMGKKIEAATQGRIKFQMFPGSVLGDEKSMIEQTQVGAIQILRTSLASVILRMAALELGDIAAFPFVEPPSPRMMAKRWRGTNQVRSMMEIEINLMKMRTQDPVLKNPFRPVSKR